MGQLIQLTVEADEFLQLGTSVVIDEDLKYFHLPYWYKQINKEGLYEELRFENLPKDLTNAIDIIRNTVAPIAKIEYPLSPDECFKRINLEEIFNNYVNLKIHYKKDELKKDLILAMKEACDQTVELCAENAKYKYYMYMFKNRVKYIDSETLEIDKDSILKTKEQIK